MGLALSTLRFLVDAHQDGASFKDTLTLGRVQLYLRDGDFGKIARIARRTLSDTALKIEFGGFADPALRELLDIEYLAALDYSDYQGASILHDLNRVIPSHLEQKFDAVIDAGTIEHVFNFPVAIANCMNMVRLGGHLFIMTTANNHCGHGFYQFSPEVFFRLFQNSNGFRLKRLWVLAHPFSGLELSGRHHCYSVHDPDQVGERIGLVSSGPVLLLVQAQRESHKEILREFPQQSDYLSLWHSSSEQKDRRGFSSGFVDRLRALFNRTPDRGMFRPLKTVALVLAGVYRRFFVDSFRNRRFYQPVKSTGSRNSRT